MTEKESVDLFLNKVSSRIGPANAIGLLQDARLNALYEMVRKLGLSEEDIKAINDKHLEQVSSDIISKVPILSPIQNRPR